MQLPRLAEAGSVAAAVAAAVDDIRGFSVEKHGVAPDVTLSDVTLSDGTLSDVTLSDGTLSGARAHFVPAFVHYALGELLKNAVQAMVARHGAWDLDEAPPIVVTVRADVAAPPGAAAAAVRARGGGADDGSSSRRALVAAPLPCAPDVGAAAEGSAEALGAAPLLWVPDGAAPVAGGAPRADVRVAPAPAPVRDTGGAAGGGWWSVEVRDEGGGMDPAAVGENRGFFRTSTPPREASYGYSKAHGAQYSGLGVGMPLTVLYVELMGGEVHWSTADGCGVAVTMTLPMGGFSFCPAPAPR